MLASASLVLVSIAAGIALLWIFSKTSDQARIRTTKKRLQARLLELRLYADDPRVVLRAQRALFTENLRYFALMLRPAVFATLPMILLLIVMDGFYGYRPLPPGESAVVTVQMRGGTEPAASPRIEVPDGFIVETPAARVIPDRQVSWRIRPERPASAQLQVLAGGEEAAKSIASGDGLGYLNGRRAGSALAWLLHPGEPPLSGGAIEWIEVEYPPAEISYFGLKTHWLVWFILFSMAAAFLLKGRFGVTI